MTPDHTERTGSLGVATLRIALGLLVLLTWASNINKGLYGGDGLSGFLDWLFTSAEDGGNGSTLTVYKSLLDSTVLKAPGVFGAFQLVVEGLIAVGLLLGCCTRLVSIGALLFFGNLFLAYFGGEEWIGTYVLLGASAFAVFLDWGGRKLGVDQLIADKRGPSPAGLIW